MSNRQFSFLPFIAAMFVMLFSPAKPAMAQETTSSLAPIQRFSPEAVAVKDLRVVLNGRVKLMGGGSQPVPTTTQRPLNCVGDALYLAEWNSANIRLACREGDGQVRQNIFVGYAPGTSQIFQKDGAEYFYSASGRLIQTWNIVDQATGMAQYIYQWRVMGSGVITGVDGNVVSLNLPWDWENYKFYLYSQSNYYSEPAPPPYGFNAACVTVVSNSWGDQFCLDAYNNRILRARNYAFGGLDFQHTEVLLEGEQILAMGSDPTARESKVFALIAPTVQCPNVPTVGPVPCETVKPGRLVEIFTGYGGKSVVNDLVSGLGTNIGRGQLLAVGKEGIYFPVSQDQIGWSVMMYNFATRTSTVFLSADDPGFVNPPFFGAIAIRQ